MEDRIEFDSVITEKALNDFKMYHVFHNVGGVFGYVFAAFAIVMCVLGVIFKMSPKYIVMMGLFGVFFFFYPIVNMRLGTKKQMKTVVAFKEPMHYSAGEDKIIVSQGDMSEERLNASKASADNVIDQYISNINVSLNRLIDINSSLEQGISDLRAKIEIFKNNGSAVNKDDIVKALNDLINQMNNASNASEQLAATLKPVLEHFKEEDLNNGGYNQALYDSLISSLNLMPELIKGATQTLETFTNWYMQSDTKPQDLLIYLDNVLAQCQTSISSLNNILKTSVSGSVNQAGNLFKTSISSIYNSLISASDNLTSVSTIINGADSTLTNVNITLDTMSNLINNIKNTLDKADKELDELKADGKYEIMQKLLDKNSS